jgi:hypothetical protein
MARRRSGADVFGVAAAVVLAACVLSIAATVIAAATRIAVTPSIAIAAALSPLLVRTYARRALGPRGAIYAAVAALVTVPVVFLGASSALGEPIRHDLRCGLGLMGLAIVAPFGLVLLGTPAAMASWVLVGRERPLLDRAMRIAAIVAVAGASMLVVLSTVRRAHKPEAKGYIASLPIVAELGSDAWRAAELSELSPLDHQFSGPPFTYAQRTDLPNGPTLYRACRDGGECRLWIRGRAALQVDPTPSWTRADSTYRVQRDEAHDLFVVDGAGPTLIAHGDGRARLPLYPRDVRDGLAAPRDWIVGASLGVLFAIALLVRGRSREQRAAAVRHREGFVTGDGTVVFNDGASIASPTSLTEGTAVTAIERGAVTTTFRSLSGMTDVAEGTLADRAAEARAEGTNHAAWALVIVTATAAPLVACIVHGVAF